MDKQHCKINAVVWPFYLLFVTKLEYVIAKQDVLCKIGYSLPSKS